MKIAITGGTKGPTISSHPRHIGIMDKQDGSANFQCMRINFDSRADRNLFCQDRLAVQQLRAYAIKIEVGQEESGTTMKPSAMIVHWCEEEQAQEINRTQPTHETTTTTTMKSNKYTTHTSKINTTTHTNHILFTHIPTHTPHTQISSHTLHTYTPIHTLPTNVTHTMPTHTPIQALPTHTPTHTPPTNTHPHTLPLHIHTQTLPIPPIPLTNTPQFSRTKKCERWTVGTADGLERMLGYPSIGPGISITRKTRPKMPSHLSQVNPLRFYTIHTHLLYTSPLSNLHSHHKHNLSQTLPHNPHPISPPTIHTHPLYTSHLSNLLRYHKYNLPQSLPHIPLPTSPPKYTHTFYTHHP